MLVNKLISKITEDDIAGATEAELQVALESLLGWRLALCKGIARVKRQLCEPSRCRRRSRT